MPNEDDKKTETQTAAEVDAKKQDDAAAAAASASTETTDEGEGTGASTAEAGERTWSPDKKRFTQFKGDDVLEYLENLEAAYGNSYKEIERIRAEKLAEVANATTDADKDKKTDDQKQPPALADVWVSQEMQRRHVEQYKAFAEKHPEVNTDEVLFDKLDKETGRYMDYIYKTENRIVELAEALDFAWPRVAPAESKDEKVASAVKDAGSGSKTTGASRDPAKPLFTDKQIEAAKRIDPTLRDKSRTEIEEILAKYK